MTAVLAVVEQEEADVDGASRKALTFARGVADAESAELHVAVVGPLGDGTHATLREQGVARVHVLEHGLLDAYAPAASAEALVQLLAARPAPVVIAPASGRGNEVLAHVAARTDLPLAVNCVAARSTPDGAWELTRERWGGVLLEDARLEVAASHDPSEVGTALLTVVPHRVTAAAADRPGAAEVAPFAPDLDDGLVVARVRDRVARSARVGLATAPVVVSGGRGVGSAEGFALLEELADLLGGAVGCSRVATNNGWRSHDDQVGQTGTRVAPDLYLAFGISGATQHWVGCMSSKRILAVNTDPDAPMVTRAHHAVIGDLHELLPALVDEVRRRKGRAADVQAAG